MQLMSIIKVEISVPEAVKAVQRFKENRTQALNELTNEIKVSFKKTIDTILDTEMTLFLGEADQQDNKRNGYKEKDYTIKGLGTIRLKVPQDRKSQFNSSVIPKSERMDPRLREDMAVLNLAGISNRTLGMISRRILGIEVSKDTINSSLNLIENSAIKWLERPLTENYWALYIDGTNFKIQRRGDTDKEPSLVVLGVDQHDHRSILSIEPGYKDNVDSWRSVFASLRSRGLNMESVKLGIMDGLPGLERAFAEAFPKAKTARCWVHAKKNAVNKCPARLRVAFKELVSNVMYADSYQDAKAAFETLKRQMGSDGKRAVSCIEKDLESLLLHYTFDKSYWRTLKTTNPVERVNKELKRRTKSMEGFGERSLTCLMAFTALRLEMGWRMYTVNDKRHENINHLYKGNAVEETVAQLLQ
jgi:putative transposase